MSAGDTFRAYGLGATGLSGAARRRGVDPEHVAKARSLRPRMGWQSIAKILGVNELDLRAACGTAEQLQAMQPQPAAPAPKQMKPAAAPAPAEPAGVKRGRGRAPTRQLGALRAIRDGLATHAEIAKRLKIPERHSVVCVSLLKGQKLIAPRGKAESGWTLTEAGEAQLRSWEAAHG